MIKAIAIDFGGVLFAEGKAVALDNLKKDFDYNPELVSKVLTSDKSFDLRKGLLSDEFFWDWAKSQLPPNYDVSKIKQYWYDGYVLDEDIFNLLKQLKGKYLLIAFSGNIASRIDYLESKYHFRQLFDLEVYSFDYHLIKPDEKFLEIMITKSGVNPSELVYIDDSVKDSSNAKKLGIKLVIYKRGQIKQLLGELSKYHIQLPN